MTAYLLIIFFNGGFRIAANLIREAAWGSLLITVSLSVAFMVLFSWSWLIYSSGEVMHSDAKELHFAKRRFWTQWRKRGFKKEAIAQLSYARRGGSKTRNYSVLTFQADGNRNDVLEDISLEDAVHVLKACRSLGYDCVLPEIYPNYDGHMNADIEKRGWLVNPWRPDAIEDHPKD